MTGVESITHKILGDANEKADQIIEAAKETAEEILKKSAEDIKLKMMSLQEDASRQASLQAERLIAATHLEGKKDYLNAKQALIQEVFDDAVASLAKLDDEAYEALITQMSDGIQGEIKHLPRNKDKGTGGGFVALDGKVEYNFSFEALAKNAKERLEKEVISILFD